MNAVQCVCAASGVVFIATAFESELISDGNCGGRVENMCRDFAVTC